MKNSEVVGYAGGTFDLFHYGHVEFFRRCKQECDTLVVSLNPDDFAERYKRRPIYNLTERFALIDSCRLVDRVVINWKGEDSRPAILGSGASLILHGDDWPEYSLIKQMGLSEAWLLDNEIEFCYVPYTEGVSSTMIAERIKARL